MKIQDNIKSGRTYLITYLKISDYASYSWHNPFEIKCLQESETSVKIRLNTGEIKWILKSQDVDIVEDITESEEIKL